MSEDWPRTKIGECCDILDNLRVPLNAEERDDIQGEIPYYGANGLQGYIDKFIFDEPLILLAEDGGYFDEYESRSIAYRISGKSWVNNHAHILRARAGSSFSQDFIFYCIEHKNITPFIKGGTRAKLNQSELREILIPKPPEDIQRRIAEILSALDETIEQTEALIAKYQQIKSGLMHDLFTRGITPNGKLRPTRAEAPQLYKDSPLGWIPKEWEIESLASVGEVVDSLHRTPQFETEGFPMVRVTDITGGELELSSCVKVNKSTYEEFTTGHKPRAGDIVLSRVGTYGIASYVSTQEPFCMGQNTVIITKLPNPYFVFQFLGSNSARNQFDQAVAGSSQKTLSLAAIKKSLVPWPEKTEREIIDKVFHAVNEQLFNLRLSLKKLRQQKHGLMHDLLTGRVRVKVADS